MVAKYCRWARSCCGFSTTGQPFAAFSNRTPRFSPRFLLGKAANCCALCSHCVSVRVAAVRRISPAAMLMAVALLAGRTGLVGISDGDLELPQPPADWTPAAAVGATQSAGAGQPPAGIPADWMAPWAAGTLFFSKVTPRSWRHVHSQGASVGNGFLASVVDSGE